MMWCVHICIKHDDDDDDDDKTEEMETTHMYVHARVQELSAGSIHTIMEMRKAHDDDVFEGWKF